MIGSANVDELSTELALPMIHFKIEVEQTVGY